MDKKVIVLMPNGRRQNIKTTPNTTLLQILEEVCKKNGLSSDEYGLKHHNKEIGLTQMFRFSGLPNNCLLEMFEMEKKRIESDVDICIQLENGSRVQKTFAPSWSIWSILLETCPNESTNFKSPVVVYMRQEIIGQEQLNATNLRSLGITSGRAMLRFVDKDPEALKTQANVYVPAQTKIASDTMENVEKSRHSGKSETPKASGFAITTDLVQKLKKTTETGMDVPMQSEDDLMESADERSFASEKLKYDWDTSAGHSLVPAMSDDSAKIDGEKDMEIEPEVNYIGERSAVVYSLDAVQKSLEELPDSFYDLTVSDLKMVLRDLKKVATGTENSPMLTSKLRELEETKTMLNKLNQYKNCVIRIQFPDRHVLQGIFKPTDKIFDVIEFVRKFLQNEHTKFQLFTISPKTVMSPDKTLLESNCVPTAVFHFDVSETDENFSDAFLLRTEILKNLTTPENAIYAAKISRINYECSASRENKDPIETGNNEPTRTCNPSSGAIPKRPRNDYFDDKSRK